LLIFKSPDLNPLDSCKVQYQDAIYAKSNQHCRAEDCLASIWNYLPQEFTVISKDFDIVLLQMADTLNLSLNTERAADIHYWSEWSVDKKLCKVWFVIK